MVERGVDLHHQSSLATDEVHSADPVVVTNVDLSPQLRDHGTSGEVLEATFESAPGRLLDAPARLDQLAHQLDAGPPPTSQLIERAIHEGRVDQTARPHRVVGPLDPARVVDRGQVEQRACRSGDRDPAPLRQVVGQETYRPVQLRKW